MRTVVLLLALLVVPGAGAWSLTVDAPEATARGVPVHVEACADAEEAQFRIVLMQEGRAAGAVLFPDGPLAHGRYGSTIKSDESGRACQRAALTAHVGEGVALLDVRVRDAPGRPPRAQTTHEVRVETALVAVVHAARDVEVWSASTRLASVRAGEETTLVPLLAGATALRIDGAWRPIPPPDAWRLVEARQGALRGVLLENVGTRPQTLAGTTLGGSTLIGPGLVDPGQRIFLGPAVPPDAPAHAIADVRIRAGTLELRHADHVFARLDLPTMRSGESFDGHDMGRQGTTALPLVREEIAGRMVAYATPDAGAAPLVAFIGEATHSLHGELYTLTSPEVGAAIVAAATRGIDVHLLLEGAPVGGVPPAQEHIVARLVEAGARVDLMLTADGFPARYRNQHAKMLVADEARIHVATENPTPSSYPAIAGAGSSRGYGVIIENATLARRALDVLQADLAPWPDVQAARPPPRAQQAIVPLAGGTAGETLALEGTWNVTLFLSPDHALHPDALLGRIENATTTLDVALLLANPKFGDDDNPFVAALVDAARRGVSVRLLLNGRFDDAGNGAVVERLQHVAREESLPLMARLASPEATLHAKLVLVDGEAAYVGSMNWGEASGKRNREAGLYVENATLAQWYGSVFSHDWTPLPEPEATPLPMAFIFVSIVLALGIRRGRLRART